MLGPVTGVGKCFVTNCVPFTFEGLLSCVTSLVNLLIFQSGKGPGASGSIWSYMVTFVWLLSCVDSEMGD